MDRRTLVDHIHTDRARLEELVAALDDAQLGVPAPDGGWAVKDHLTHLAAWERMIVAHLRDGTDHAVAGLDEASYATATLDELNGRLHQLHRDASLDDVRREFAAAHAAIVEFIQEMPETRLSEVYWDNDPSGRTVQEKIAGDTYLHYREHEGWIRELVGPTTEAGRARRAR